MSTYKLTPHGSVTRLPDGASIPADPANTDYAEYLRWVEAGGVPDPVDPPDPREAILAEIAALEATVTNRRLREAALTEAGKAWLADVDTKIAVLRASL
jgi:hypothetical protein